MQTVVDRVMRAFAIKHPLTEAESQAIRREVTEFAAELLEKYKTQLAQRAPPPHSH